MMEVDGFNGPEWDTWKGTLAKVMFIPTLVFVCFAVGKFFS